MNIYHDKAGIAYKHINLDQFDQYDAEIMIKLFSKYSNRVGSLIITFSELEHTLDSAISFIIDQRSDDLGLLISMDLSYSQKIRLYHRICGGYMTVMHSKKDKRNLAYIMSDLELAGYIRNLVAHAKWFSLDNDGYVRTKARMSDDAWVQHRYYKLTPKVMYDKERWINKVHSNFYSFISKYDLI